MGSTGVAYSTLNSVDLGSWATKSNNNKKSASFLNVLLAQSLENPINKYPPHVNSYGLHEQSGALF